jgi:hypothetical protein
MSVVALVAYCDVRDPVTPAEIDRAQPPTQVGWSSAPVEGSHDDGRSLSFSIAELAILSDGRRVHLHADHGFTTAHWPPGDRWAGLSASVLESNVLTTMLPDDDDTGEEHPCDWLAALCADHGLPVTADELRQVPYRVEFSDRVQHAVASRPGS